MDETTQQNHLKELIQQKEALQTEINNLQNVMSSKRDLFLKVQGAIEYLTQIGVTLSEVEQTPSEEPEES